MLRLKKKNYQLHFSKREKFFNKTILHAFLLTCCLHALGFTLFKIKPITFSGTTWIFPAVSVLTDQDSIKGLSLEKNLTPTENRWIHHLIIPDIDQPELLEMSSNRNLQSKSVVSEIFSNNDELFGQLEKTLSFFDPEILPPKKQNPLNVLVSGKLAEIELLDNGITDSLSIDLKGEYYLKYRVKMDNETGRIIWFELQESNNKLESQNLAESILKNIRFNINPYALTTDGNIEIYL